MAVGLFTFKNLRHRAAERDAALRRLTVHGLPVVVENDAGSVRSWSDPDGKQTGWTHMHYPYGFIEGHVGADGDELDCYVGTDPAAEYVYIVHQMKAPDFLVYDECKCFLAFPSVEAAIAAYWLHRRPEEKWLRPGPLGSMSVMRVEDFLRKLRRRQGSGKIRAEVSLPEPEASRVRSEGKLRREYFDPARLPGVDPVKYQLRLLGSIGRYVVWAVRGWLVRRELDIDFTADANPGRYAYPPLGQIWIDGAMVPVDIMVTVVHAVIECELMRRGYSYDVTHALASVIELRCRDAWGTPAAVDWQVVVAAVAEYDLTMVAMGRSFFVVMKGTYKEGDHPRDSSREFKPKGGGSESGGHAGGEHSAESKPEEPSKALPGVSVEVPSPAKQKAAVAERSADREARRAAREAVRQKTEAARKKLGAPRLPNGKIDPAKVPGAGKAWKVRVSEDPSSSYKGRSYTMASARDGYAEFAATPCSPPKGLEGYVVDSHKGGWTNGDVIAAVEGRAGGDKNLWEAVRERYTKDTGYTVKNAYQAFMNVARWRGGGGSYISKAHEAATEKKEAGGDAGAPADPLTSQQKRGGPTSGAATRDWRDVDLSTLRECHEAFASLQLPGWMHDAQNDQELQDQIADYYGDTAGGTSYIKEEAAGPGADEEAPWGDVEPEPGDEPGADAEGEGEYTGGFAETEYVDGVPF